MKSPKTWRIRIEEMIYLIIKLENLKSFCGKKMLENREKSRINFNFWKNKKLIKLYWLNFLSFKNTA